MKIEKKQIIKLLIFLSILCIGSICYADENVVVTAVELNKTMTSIETGLDETLIATVLPVNATNKNIHWSSSDARIAIVNNEGRVTTFKEGEVTITAKTEDGNITATCLVKVTSDVVEVEYVALDKIGVSLIVGETKKINATVYPIDATNQEIVWLSSDSKIARVDKNGNITGVSKGVVIITAATRSGSKIAECRVKVDQFLIPIQGLSLNVPKLELEKGRYGKFEATITPSNATYSNINWTSSNEDVALVDINGVVKAVGIGEATITATAEDGSKTVSGNVKVSPVTLKGINLNASTLSISEGQTTQIEVTYIPDDAPNKNVTYESSRSSVATVDENGLIRAIKAGTTNITVTSESGEFVKVCKVTVTESITSVKSVKLNVSSLNMIKGTTTTLVATILPENAENKKLIWSSSDENVVTVDENGIVTAKELGTTKIKVVSENGWITAHCSITVSEKPLEISLVISSNMKYEINDENNLIYGIIPNTKVKDFLDKITTNSEEYGIYDMQDNLLSEDDIIGTGMKLKLSQGIEYLLAVTSDLNGDGKRTAVDISRMKLRLVGIITFTQDFEKAADINNSGNLTAVDLSMIKQLSIGLIELTDTK